MAVNVALYGSNGHQIQDELLLHPGLRLVATADFPKAKLPPALRDDTEIRHCETLDEILSDPRVDLVSLCSPHRCNQARDAIRALRAGKHVYAEKPCAMTEADLDAILAAVRETGRQFHEMAGTAFGQPYLAMRNIVRSGKLGEIVQVIAEKSYPYYAGRPQDEDIDGGLIAQNAIHAIRLVMQVAGAEISSVQAIETGTGNPVPDGGLRMAAGLIFRLGNGGVASIAANYLNPRGTGIWGNESLRILGTLGSVESSQGGQQTRFVLGDTDCGPIPTDEPGVNYLSLFLASLLGKGEMPLTLEEELTPTRWAIRARDAAQKGE